MPRGSRGRGSAPSISLDSMVHATKYRVGGYPETGGLLYAAGRVGLELALAFVTDYFSG